MKLKHLKNVIVIAVGFLLIFIAFGGLQTLQSSLNPSEGLGAVSLSVTYGGQIFSAAVLAPFIINKLGCKWTLVITMCFFNTYTLANFYPKWYTLIPTSVIQGLGASPFWAAKCTYLTVSARHYAAESGELDLNVINQYFGIFFFIFQSSRIWGNLISSLIMDLGHKNNDTKTWNNTGCGASEPLILTENMSLPHVEQGNETGNWTNSSVKSVSSIHIILGVYSACGLVALLLITIFLDPINHQTQNANINSNNFWAQFLLTLKHLQDKRQCLLIPLTIYSGMVQGFILSDYTKSYVTCYLGLQYVGYVIMIYGATASVFSYVFGKLCQYIRRICFFILATAFNISTVVILLIWEPQHYQLGVFFVISGLWGTGDAVWQALLNGFYGILFEDDQEAAFSNYLLWKSLGYVLSFGYSSFLGAYVKLYILLATLLFGMMLYVIVEYKEFRKTRVQVHSFNGVENIK
ncbi:protein unc-93 homolog A-like [Gastrophryne carolinensis]